MIFIEVELAHAIVVKKFRNFEEGKETVENQQPSRWSNPALIVVDEKEWKTFRYTGEREIFHFGDFDTLPVVAIPNYDFGYGNRYREVIEENRKRFGLT